MNEPNSSIYRTRTFVLFFLFLLLFTLPNIAFLFVPRSFWAQPAVVTAAPIVPIVAFLLLLLVGVRILQLPALLIIQSVAGAGLSSIIISLVVLAATGRITSSNIAKLMGFVPPILFFIFIFSAFRKASGKKE